MRDLTWTRGFFRRGSRGTYNAEIMIENRRSCGLVVTGQPLFGSMLLNCKDALSRLNRVCLWCAAPVCVKEIKVTFLIECLYVGWNNI